MSDRTQRFPQSYLVRVTRFGGVLARVGFVLFGVEAVIMMIFELVWPHVRQWHHLFMDMWVLAIATATSLYFAYIKPLDRKLNATLEELRRAKEQAERLSRIDPLTGLLNRRTFFARFDQEYQRACRNGTPLSCVMLDLDFFKRINETHGHIAGDAALKSVADVLQAHCRSYDHVGRYGGEEFCLVLPETDEEQAAAIAERVRVAIAETPAVHSDKSVRVTASFGVAQQDEKFSGVEDLVNRADLASLKAKRMGRNRVVTASSMDRRPEEEAILQA